MSGPVLGVIGGTGWLGGALVRAALETGAVSAAQLWLSSRSGRAAGFDQWPGLCLTRDNAELAEACDIIILSVRPEDLGAVALDLSGKLVISVMARVTGMQIIEQFGSPRVIRSMPNASAEDRLSFTPLYVSPAVTADDRLFAERFFAASGMVTFVETEGELDYYTALTGSGPAFVAAFCDTMIRDAVANGLAPDVADRAVRQLFLGAGKLIARSQETPAEIVRTFVDYGGTTSAGLKAMIAADIDTPISAGLAAATAKAANR